MSRKGACAARSTAFVATTIALKLSLLALRYALVCGSIEHRETLRTAETISRAASAAGAARITRSADVMIVPRLFWTLLHALALVLFRRLAGLLAGQAHV